MAVSSKSNQAPAVARESVQPKAATANPEPPVATSDVVAMVSRDANGDPAQSAGYRVLVADDATPAEKDAAHNEAGAKQPEAR